MFEIDTVRVNDSDCDHGDEFVGVLGVVKVWVSSDEGLSDFDIVNDPSSDIVGLRVGWRRSVRDTDSDGESDPEFV